MWTYTLYSELYHHGVPGQKWGERNGPPYPIDSAKRDRLDARAERRKERADAKAKKVSEKQAQKEKDQLFTKKQKKIIALGAAVTGLAYLAVKTHRQNVENKANAELKRVAKETGYKKLSDEELEKKIDRLKMERKFVSVALGKGNPYEKSGASSGKKESADGGKADATVSKGRSFVNGVFNSENATSIGKSVLINVATNALSGGISYGLSALASGNFSRAKLGEAMFNGGAKKK